MNKKIYAVMTSTAVATMLTAAISTTAFAKVDGFLVKDGEKLLSYNYQSLINSSENNIMGMNSALYDDYMTKELVAFHDDKAGYVSKESVEAASEDDAMNDKEFDLDKFAENAKSNQLYKVTGHTTERVEKDGKVIDKETGKDTDKPVDIDINKVKLELTPATTEVKVNPGQANEPVEIAVKINGLPKNLEATLAFSSTWGQIVREETTTNGQVNVKLYPQEDSEVQIANVTAKILTVKDTVTGEVYNNFKNVKSGITNVKFIPSTAGEDTGKVYQIVGGLADQADRVYVNLNKNLNNGVLKKLQDHPESIHVYNVYNDDDKDKEPIIKDPIKVKKVVRKDGDTIVLILDTKDKNFPLTDNAKHLVKFDYADKELVFVKGQSKFFLEDSNYIRMMKVQTSKEDKTLKYNQLRVIFNEAVNNVVDETAQGFSYSVQNKSNWVIDGLNLKNNLPSGNEKNVEIEVKSVKKDTVERESVVITFKDSKDVKEFISNHDGKIKSHKLQVNNVGDWASVTDKANKVATQELEYNSIKMEVAKAELTSDSPEQFVVKFNVPVKYTGDLSERFTLVVPDFKPNADGKVKEDPYAKESRKFGLTKGDIHVTEIDEETFVVELTKDWTRIFDTDTTKSNYHDDYYNKVRIDVNGFTDIIGNKIEKEKGIGVISTNVVTLKEDVQSPKVEKSVQLTKDLLKDNEEIKLDFKLNDKSEMNQKELGLLRNAGAELIIMNEPVQFVDQNGNKMDSTQTESEQQIKSEINKEHPSIKVPVATFEYVQVKDANGNAVTSDKTINGAITKLVKVNDVHETRDFAAIVEPVKELTEGEWKLVVRSISDDIGNTMKTSIIGEEIGETIKIVRDKAIDELKLVNIDAHHTVAGDSSNYYKDHTWLKEYKEDKENTNDAKDIIHIKFNKNMALTGDSSVLNKNNYRLDGAPLPVDGTRIERGILGEAGKETSRDSVTIVLPDGYLQERDTEHVLTIMNVRDEDNKLNALNDRVEITEKGKEMHDHSTITPEIPEEQIKEAKKELNTVILDVKKLKEEDYTVESYKTFNKVVQEANKVLNNENATERQLKDAVKSIEDARVKLERKDGKEEVKATVEQIGTALLGKTIVVAVLPKDIDATKYDLTIDGQKLKYNESIKKFTLALDGTFTKEDLQNKIKVVIK